MASSAWKKREIENREGEFLKIARKLLIEKGLAGLTMDRIAERTDYSKGTIYQHFSSKEDVIAALCLEMDELRFSLMQRASLFKGRSRERGLALAAALGIIYRLHPDFWKVEEVVMTISLRERLSEARRLELDRLKDRTFGVVLGVIRDGMASGDLAPPYGLTPEQIFLGMTSVLLGLYGTWSADWWDRTWVDDSTVVHDRLFSAVCDGFCWRPLGTEWDYAATMGRIWAEVFPEERAQIRALAAQGKV